MKNKSARFVGALAAAAALLGSQIAQAQAQIET